MFLKAKDSVSTNNTSQMKCSIGDSSPLPKYGELSIEPSFSNFPSAFDIEKLLNKIKKPEITDFELIKLIGQGTTADVFLAKEKESGELVAIKCISKEKMEKDKTQDLIKNEFKLLESLTCPFVIRLKNTFEDSLKTYFVMEFCRGGDLFSHLQKKRKFSEEEAKFLAAEIIVSLEYLHSKNIIYRDLKPENIALSEEGHIKLIDFGFSKQLESSESLTSNACGTPEYFPPEVILGKKYSFNVDWWCLGVIIYELINGHPPFTDKTQNGLFTKIVFTDPEYNTSKMTSQCIDLLKSLLNKDIDQRIAQNDIKTHPWFDNINFEGIRDLAVIPPYHPGKMSIESPCIIIEKELLKETENVAKFDQNVLPSYDNDCQES
jgi:serine/threonine protein kinase